MNDSLDQTLIFPPQRKRPRPSRGYPVFGCPRWCTPNDPCLRCEDAPGVSPEEEEASYRRALAACNAIGERNARLRAAEGGVK